MDQVIKLLQIKRFEIGLGSVTEFKTTYNRTDVIKKIKLLQPPIQSIPTYLGFSKSKKHEGLAKRFGEAMKRFRQTAEYFNILKKYKME